MNLKAFVLFLVHMKLNNALVICSKEAAMHVYSCLLCIKEGRLLIVFVCVVVSHRNSGYWTWIQFTFWSLRFGYIFVGENDVMVVARRKVNACSTVQGFLTPQRCILCKRNGESLNRILLCCSVALSHWYRLFWIMNINLTIPTDSFSFIWDP